MDLTTMKKGSVVALRSVQASDAKASCTYPICTPIQLDIGTTLGKEGPILCTMNANFSLLVPTQPITCTTRVQMSSSMCMLYSTTVVISLSSGVCVQRVCVCMLVLTDRRLYPVISTLL